MLILVCTQSNELMLDEGATVCWTGKHRHYAAITLILIGYYIPLSTMIAPMFDEVCDDDEESQKEEKDAGAKEKKCFCCKRKQKIKQRENPYAAKSKLKKFLSMNNSIRFVKPFISAITCTKCWMLITSTFIFKGGAIGTIISQSIACFMLLIFSFWWTLKSLNQCGLTQNEPGFPFGVSLLRSFGFFAAIIGCFVEGLKILSIIDETFDVILLLIILIVSCVLLMGLLWKYHRKFDQYDDDINVHLAVMYDPSLKKVKFV